MKKEDKPQNFVAKHARTFNKAHVFTDKKNSKKEYRKHKKDYHQNELELSKQFWFDEWFILLIVFGVMLYVW